MAEETLKLPSDPVASDASYEVSGKGYTAKEVLSIELRHSEMTWSPRRLDVTVTEAGSFSLSSTPRPESAGTIAVTVWRRTPDEDSGGRVRTKLVPVATGEVIVAEVEDDSAKD